LKNKRLKIILAACSLVIIGFLFFLFRNQIFADIIQPELPPLPVSQYCKINSDCNDSFDYTDDICINPNTPQAICKHQANRPIVYGYGVPTIDDSNFLDSIDIFTLYYNPYSYKPGQGTTGINQVRKKIGNDSTEVKIYTNKELKNLGKISVFHVNMTAMSGYCSQAGTKDIAPEEIDSCSQKMAETLYGRYFGTKDENGDFVWNGLQFDELLGGYVKALPNSYKAIAKAFLRLKQARPDTAIFVWGTAGDFDGENPDGTPVYSETDKENFAGVLKSADYYLPEFYYSSAAADSVTGEMKTKLEFWPQFFQQYGVFTAGKK
jgi:hypothetical protein